MSECLRGGRNEKKDLRRGLAKEIYIKVNVQLYGKEGTSLSHSHTNACVFSRISLCVSVLFTDAHFAVCQIEVD